MIENAPIYESLIANEFHLRHALSRLSPSLSAPPALARPSQSLATSHSSLFFSNRYSKLLESPVTHTKQTTAPRSNRYKSTLISGAADGKRLSFPLDSSFHPPVSNRPHPRLEITVTCTKHRVGPVSNRPYFAFLELPGTFFAFIRRPIRARRFVVPVSRTRFDMSVIIITGRAANPAEEGRQSHTEKRAACQNVSRSEKSAEL